MSRAHPSLRDDDEEKKQAPTPAVLYVICKSQSRHGEGRFPFGVGLESGRELYRAHASSRTRRCNSGFV
jgi:hypothetical protein